MIRRLALRNFKCFLSQQLDFRNLTLLSGLNGMGKSTVLQSLLLLRQSYKQGALPESGLALNGELVTIGKFSDAFNKNALLEETIDFDLLFSDGKQAHWSFYGGEEANVLALKSAPVRKADIDLASTLLTDDFTYIEAERTGPRTFFGMSDYDVCQHRQIGKKGEYASHFLSLFEHEQISNPSVAHPTVADLGLRDQLEGWLQEIRPGTRLHIQGYPDGIDILTLHFSFDEGTQVSSKFRAMNVGFGLTYTLPVVLALVSAKPGSLVLLENPEAHLHPKGQAKLGELIALAASGGVQVIVETHSDHILNGIRVATYYGKISPDAIALHFFESVVKDDVIQVNVRHPHIDSDGRIDEWPDGFFDEWEKSLGTLLMPKEEDL